MKLLIHHGINRKAKTILIFLIVFISLSRYSFSQLNNFNIQSLAVISPFTGTVGIGEADRKYSGCWGYTHPLTQQEYAILGSCIGTYFIDISNPATASVTAFVPGRISTSWREIKTYQNYCYVISDDPSPNSFQIIDMSDLPNSVNLVYDGTDIFERAHTLFIDKDKLYLAHVTSLGGAAYSAMSIYSLANPSQPVLLRKISDDLPFIAAVHDMYVNNDTIYASCGPVGLYVIKYDEQQNKFVQLGSLSNYAAPMANHSSWLSKDKKHLIFCDEISGAPIRAANVENFSNIQLVASFIPGPHAVPHNPYILNDLAIVSCYQDGINIYNISNLNSVYLAGRFDTYPEGGLNTGDYGNDKLKGNWAAYPFFPSGRIIASDINNGLFVFDITDAVTSTSEIQLNYNQIKLYPNPANNLVKIVFANDLETELKIFDPSGRIFYQKSFKGVSSCFVKLEEFDEGTYIVSIESKKGPIYRKLIISR
jgi:choice-of-anchor B domain-containing protein